jgi:hypothetical protein
MQQQSDSSLCSGLQLLTHVDRKLRTVPAVQAPHQHRGQIKSSTQCCILAIFQNFNAKSLLNQANAAFSRDERRGVAAEKVQGSSAHLHGQQVPSTSRSNRISSSTAAMER